MILSYLRTIVLYLVLILAVRVMGKRQIGEMEPAEFVVTMLVANLAAIPMQDGGIPLLTGLIPILTVLGVELVLSAGAVLSIRVRRILCGKPVILMENGNFLPENLKSTRITLDELTGLLRQKNILDPRTVQYAILETNGELSVFPFPANAPASAKDAGVQAKAQYLPVTVVSDGKILTGNLKKVGKNEKWLENVLSGLKTDVKKTLLRTVDPKDNLIFYPKGGRK